MADETFEILVQIREKLKGLEATTREFKEAKREAKAFGQTAKIAFGSFIGTMGTRAVAGLQRGLSSLVMEGFRYMANVEQQTIAISKLVGGMENAKRVISDLEAFAARTPFRLESLIEGRRNLEIFTKGAVTSEEWMRLIGDAAAGTANNFEEVTFWTGRLYSQMANGDPIGEATLRLMEMGIISGDVRKELEGVSSGAEGMQILAKAFQRYAGSMDEQSESLNGRLSTLEDNLSKVAAAFVSGASGGDDLNDQLETLNELLSDAGTLEKAAAYGEILHGIGRALLFIKEGADVAGFLAGAAWESMQGRPGWQAMHEVGARDSSDEPKGSAINTNIENASPPSPPPSAIKYSPLQKGYRDLQSLDFQIGDLETDPFTPDLVGRKRELELLKEKVTVLADLSYLIAAEADAIIDSGENERAEEAINLYEKANDLLREKQEIIAEIASEDTFGGQFTAGLVEWMDGFQTFGEAASEVFTGTLDPLVNNFGQTLLSTLRAGGDEMDVLRNIGMQMFDNFVVGIANYTMQWLMSELLIRTGLLGTSALSKALASANAGAQVTVAVATTSALSSMWSGPATLATIATMGGAAAQAPLSIGASLGAVKAMSAIPGAKDGGRMKGPGGPRGDGFVIRASHDEFMIPAFAARSIGYDNLEYMRQTGEMPMSSVVTAGNAAAMMSRGGTPPASARSERASMPVIVDSRKQMRQLMRDPDFEVEVVDIMRRNRGDLL